MVLRLAFGARGRAGAWKHGAAPILFVKLPWSSCFLLLHLLFFLGRVWVVCPCFSGGRAGARTRHRLYLLSFPGLNVFFLLLLLFFLGRVWVVFLCFSCFSLVLKRLYGTGGRAGARTRHRFSWLSFPGFLVFSCCFFLFFLGGFGLFFLVFPVFPWF